MCHDVQPRSKRALPPILRMLLLLVSIFPLTAAWAVEISDFPMETLMNAPPPITLFVWDDSGSMHAEFMTPEPQGLFAGRKYLFTDPAPAASTDGEDGAGCLDDAQRCMWRSQWSGYNRLYFDPDRTYTPWPGTSRYPFGSADPQAPWTNPALTSENNARINLSDTFFSVGSGTERINIPIAHYFVLKDANADGLPNTGEPIYLVAWQDADGVGRLDLANGGGNDRRRYFRFVDDGDGCVEDGELQPVVSETEMNSLKPVVRDSLGRVERFRSDAEELQNFADWFSYHRRREYAAKDLVAGAIAASRQRYIGIYALNRTPRIGVQPVRVIEYPVGGSDADSSTRLLDRSESLLDALYAARSEGDSPLRSALDAAGRYFDQAADSVLGASPFKSAKEGGGCQKSEVIVVSDGFWNGDFSGAGNADGSMGSPFADAWRDTLADVAMTYYRKDLAPGLPDQVPIGACDLAAHQHMVTHTLALGAKGTIDIDDIDQDGARDNADYRSDPCFASPHTPRPIWPQPAAGLPATVDDLWHAAVNGRGVFLDAGNPHALIDILTGFHGGGEAVAAGCGPLVGGVLLKDGSRLYQAQYRPGEWTGDVLALGYHPQAATVDTDAGNELWRAAAHLSPSDNVWENRRIVTYGGIGQNAQGIPFRYSALSDHQKHLLGSDLSSGSPSDRDAGLLLDYIRGRESPNHRKRTSLLGDIVHSAPVLAGGTLYVGANDGMLHAFDALDGRERFAYVPRLVFEHLKDLSRPDYAGRHRFYVDATPYVGEAYVDRYERNTYLLGGLGKGGKGYFCLLLSNRKRGKISEAEWGAYETVFSVDDYRRETSEEEIGRSVLWEYPRVEMDNDPIAANRDAPVAEARQIDPDMGFSFGQGFIVNANAGAEAYRPVAIFGNGYNSDSGRAVLYVLNADTGTLVRKIDTGAGDDNGLSEPALIDANLDRRVDYVYAGDLKGNLWKFDLSADDPRFWGVAYGRDADGNGRIDAVDGDEPRPLFQCAGHQAITGRPDVMSMRGACAAQAPGYMVIFGTGKFLGPSDRNDIRQQSIYGIWDFGDDSDDSEYLGYLVDRSEGRLSSGLLLERRRVVAQFDRDGGVYRQLSEWTADYSVVEDTEDADHLRINNNTRTQQGNPARFAGWFIDFPMPPDPLAVAGERVTGNVAVRNGKAVLVSFAPADGPCERGGLSWMYILNSCGDATVDKAIARETSEMVQRFDSRINERLTIVKEASKPHLDVILCSDQAGRIFKRDFIGERWGKVFWRQDGSE